MRKNSLAPDFVCFLCICMCVVFCFCWRQRWMRAELLLLLVHFRLLWCLSAPCFFCLVSYFLLLTARGGRGVFRRAASETRTEKDSDWVRRDERFLRCGGRTPAGVYVGFFSRIDTVKNLMIWYFGGKIFDCTEPRCAINCVFWAKIAVGKLEMVGNPMWTERTGAIVILWA